VVIPKRHIETWYYYLDHPDNADTCDEDKKRKLLYDRKGVKPTLYGKKLEPLVNEIRQGKIPPNIPPSLLHTISWLVNCEKQKQPVQNYIVPIRKSP
jgi:hypothetical protein